jgi:hypothetical protein
MAYKHNDSLHNHKKLAYRARRVAVVMIIIIAVCVLIIGVDWLITKFNSDSTTTSLESNATVQSANINVFQTPYFRFQANESWREVTDELNLKNGDTSNQYLYRYFDKNFIEHELWVTVNLATDYKYERYNIPTRVQPIRIESDKSLAVINSVSDPCLSVIPPEDKSKDQRVVVQNEVEYFCDPGINQYTVTVGVPGATNKMPIVSNSGQTNTITITYRNVTAYPETSELNNILSTFKFL